MDVGALNWMIAEDAALRRRQRVRPVGSKGERIFQLFYQSLRVNRNPPCELPALSDAIEVFGRAD
jgi:hypothetical protein